MAQIERQRPSLACAHFEDFAQFLRRFYTRRLCGVMRHALDDIAHGATKLDEVFALSSSCNISMTANEVRYGIRAMLVFPSVLLR